MATVIQGDAASPSAPESELNHDKTSFNVLCHTCKTVFRRGDKRGEHRFHNVTELQNSAAMGCHFCSLLVRQMGKEREGRNVHPMNTKTPLKAETRFFPNYGMSFLLKGSRKGGLLATLDLRFKSALGELGRILVFLPGYAF